MIYPSQIPDYLRVVNFQTPIDNPGDSIRVEFRNNVNETNQQGIHEDSYDYSQGTQENILKNLNVTAKFALMTHVTESLLDKIRTEWLLENDKEFSNETPKDQDEQINDDISKATTFNQEEINETRSEDEEHYTIKDDSSSIDIMNLINSQEEPKEILTKIIENIKLTLEDINIDQLLKTMSIQELTEYLWTLEGFNQELFEQLYSTLEQYQDFDFLYEMYRGQAYAFNDTLFQPQYSSGFIDYYRSDFNVSFDTPYSNSLGFILDNPPGYIMNPLVGTALSTLYDSESPFYDSSLPKISVGKHYEYKTFEYGGNTYKVGTSNQLFPTDGGPNITNLASQVGKTSMTVQDNLLRMIDTHRYNQMNNEFVSDSILDTIYKGRFEGKIEVQSHADSYKYYQYSSYFDGITDQTATLSGDATGPQVVENFIIDLDLTTNRTINNFGLEDRLVFHAYDHNGTIDVTEIPIKLVKYSNPDAFTDYTGYHEMMINTNISGKSIFYLNTDNDSNYEFKVELNYKETDFTINTTQNPYHQLSTINYNDHFTNFNGLANVYFDNVYADSTYLNWAYQQGSQIALPINGTDNPDTLKVDISEYDGEIVVRGYGGNDTITLKTESSTSSYQKTPDNASYQDYGAVVSTGSSNGGYDTIIEEVYYEPQAVANRIDTSNGSSIKSGGAGFEENNVEELMIDQTIYDNNHIIGVYDDFDYFDGFATMITGGDIGNGANNPEIEDGDIKLIREEHVYDSSGLDHIIKTQIDWDVTDTFITSDGPINYSSAEVEIGLYHGDDTIMQTNDNDDLKIEMSYSDPGATPPNTGYNVLYQETKNAHASNGNENNVFFVEDESKNQYDYYEDHSAFFG